MRIDGISVKSEIEISEDEAFQYVKRGKEKYGKGLRGITIKADSDPEFIGIEYDVIPIQRLRRITGYLALTTKWNTAKQAEGEDRVKHDLGDFENGK